MLIDDDEASRTEVKDLVEWGDSPFECDATGTSDDVSTADYDAFLVTRGQEPNSRMGVVESLVSRARGPVVVLSDVESQTTDRRALEAGAADYLAKDRLTAETVQRALRYSVETWRERRMGERELRRYQELATAAYDHSSVAKAIVSLPGGRLISANHAVQEMLGYDLDELKGRHFRDLTHPDDVGIDEYQFQRLTDGEIDSYTIDKRYLRSDGSVIWGRLQVSRIEGTEGRNYVLSEAVDITEAKLAEERIAFQASLLEQMRTPVIATDLKGRVTHWNQQAEVAYGWTTEEAGGREFIPMVAPDIDSESLEAMRTGIRELGLWEGELTVTRKDGTRFPVWASGAVVRDASGRPAGIVGAIVDLTDVEIARAEAQAQEMLSRSLLEAVNVPIAIMDETGRPVATNPSWSTTVGEHTHGYFPGSLLSDPSPDDLTEIIGGVDAVLSAIQDHFDYEYACQTAAGDRWMRIMVRPVEDGGAIVSHWDTTDERFARTALEDTVRAKDEFITSVSHELRTPLSVVVGMAETLRTGRYAESERDEFEELIVEQAREMAMIVEDLLVAGRIDSDTLSVRETMVDLQEELESVTRAWEKRDWPAITVKLRPGAEMAYADALRVRQILRNLLTNAGRYGRPPIEVRAVRARDQVIMAVSDHGDGVPGEAIDKMFQPFARFGAVEGQPSSVGLGLHVSKRLAQLMGGDLVYKRNGDLTTFILSLPAAAPADYPPADGKRFVHA